MLTVVALVLITSRDHHDAVVDPLQHGDLHQRGGGPAVAVGAETPCADGIVMADGDFRPFDTSSYAERVAVLRRN